MKANSIEEYLGTLQSAMKESWKSHLKTHKYSDHKALNEFYDDIVDLVDTLIEGYQGLHGVVDDLKNIMSTDKMDAVKYLEELREMTEEGKKEFIEEDELKSDVDAILSLIDQTLYKLKELKEDHTLISLTDYLYENLNDDLNESHDFSNEDITKRAKGIVDRLDNGEYSENDMYDEMVMFLNEISDFAKDSEHCERAKKLLKDPKFEEMDKYVRELAK